MEQQTEKMNADIEPRILIIITVPLALKIAGFDIFYVGFSGLKV